MTPDELKAGTRAFALDTIRLTRTLPRDDASRAMGKQLVRCAESKYWLGLLRDSQTASVERIAPFEDEAEQLFRIVVASVKTLKNRQS